MVAEGISVRRIDTVAKHFGMAVDSGHPMGPLELLDLIGLPVALHVLTSLAVLGSRVESRDALLRNFLPEGKPPLTFWKSEKRIPRLSTQSRAIVALIPQEAGPISDDILHQRLFLPMVDEAVRCLQDKIVEHPWQVDLHSRMGSGSPRSVVAFSPGLGNHDASTRSPGTGVDGDQVWQTLRALSGSLERRVVVPGMS